MILTTSRSADWYSTVRFSVSISLPYRLHGVPANFNVAEKPSGFFTTSDALYPGHAVCASFAFGSSEFGRRVAPISAAEGTVKTDLKLVGVASSTLVGVPVASTGEKESATSVLETERVCWAVATLLSNKMEQREYEKVALREGNALGRLFEAIIMILVEFSAKIWKTAYAAHEKKENANAK